MNLPFTHDQFLNVFAAYNHALWPAVALLWAATAFVVLRWVRQGEEESRAVTLLLAVHWLWSGIIYHFLFFRPINPSASVFGGLFVLQGVLFAWLATKPGRLQFVRSGSLGHIVGLVFMAYGLLYPLLGVALGLQYPRMPTFSVPCPTTILTAGFLLVTTPSFPRWLCVVPIIWAAVGGSAAFVLDVRADMMLMVAGLVLFVRTFAPKLLRIRSTT